MQALIAAIALCATLFAPGSGASAQTARGVYRLGFLSPAGTLEPSIPSAANIVPKLRGIPAMSKAETWKYSAASPTRIRSSDEF